MSSTKNNQWPSPSPIAETIEESLIDHIQYVKQCHEDISQTIEKFSDLWSQLEAKISAIHLDLHILDFPLDKDTEVALKSIYTMTQALSTLTPTLEAIPDELNSMLSELVLLQGAFKDMQSQQEQDQPTLPKRKKLTHDSRR